MENRMLKLIELENEYYLKLADVERLLHDMRLEILDNATYEKNEDGTGKYCCTEAESARLDDLYFVSSCIKRRLIVPCETTEEVRAVNERIRKAYYDGKYYLSETEKDESGKPKAIYYFRKYCLGAMAARMEEEGKSKEEIEEAMQEEQGDPVFTTEAKQAKLFESLEEAEAQMTYLNYNYKSNLKVSPAFLLDTKGCKNFLDKLLKGDGEETEDQKDGGQ